MTTAHVLQNQTQVTGILKRMKRAHGQLGGVIRMMENGSSCEEVVMQLAAVSKAVNTAAFTLIAASLTECLQNPTIDNEPMKESLQKLFLSLA